MLQSLRCNSDAHQGELDVATGIAMSVDSPRALTVLLLIQYEEFDQLVTLDIDPIHYDDVSSFRRDYLCTKVLSKSLRIPTSFDLKAEALKSFYEGEERCKQTNLALTGKDAPLTVLADLREIIYSIVGSLDKRDLDFVSDSCRHGPGATVGTVGRGSVPSDKYRDTPTLTCSLIPYARSLMGDRWIGHHGNLSVVEGNKFTTVPKSAKTDRGICVEPGVNLYTQLGIGALIRTRLKQFGVDLNDQQNNRDLAAKAASEHLATIDLSLASDTLAKTLVFHLMPKDWFELLDLCRSPTTTLPDGSNVKLEKFSSMGNGYTFELESLIFLAIAIYANEGFCASKVSVFGDDIIVPQAATSRCIETLNLVGFSVNRSKSFLAGRFFESCGADWYDNQPVRPFFLRQPLSSKVPFALYVCNRIRLYSRSIGLDGCDSWLRDLWRIYYARIPKHWKKPVPPEMGDAGVIVSHAEHKCPSAANGLEGHQVSGIMLKTISSPRFDESLLFLRLAQKSVVLSSTILDKGTHVPADNPYLSGRVSQHLSDTIYGNREIVRGYLGKPRTFKTIVRWPNDYLWV